MGVWIYLLILTAVVAGEGAVIYILKKPNITEEFGFHEIFHCFILLGTLLQFVGIAFFI